MQNFSRTALVLMLTMIAIRTSAAVPYELTKGPFGEDRSGLQHDTFRWPGSATAFVIDGKLDDWPEDCLRFVVGSPAQLMNATGRNAWQGPQDASLWCRASWNRSGVLLAIEVVDSSGETNCVLSFCLADESARLLSQSMRPLECSITRDDKGGFVMRDKNDQPVTFPISIVRTATGFVVEGLVPWEYFGGDFRQNGCFLGVTYRRKDCQLSWKRTRYRYFGPLMWCNRLLKPDAAEEGTQFADEQCLLTPTASGAVVWGFPPAHPPAGNNPLSQLPYARSVAPADLKTSESFGWPIIETTHAGRALRCPVLPARGPETISELLGDVPQRLTTAATLPHDRKDPTAMLVDHYRRRLVEELEAVKPDYTLNDLVRLRETAVLADRALAGGRPGDRTGWSEHVYWSPLARNTKMYSLFLPKTYTPGQKIGLMLYLHGAGGNHMSLGASEALLGYDNPLASILENANVAIVGPEAYRFAGYGDVGLVEAMTVLDEAKKVLNIDPDRITVSGMSMGGRGTFQLGLAFPDLFAAMGPYVPWIQPPKASNQPAIAPTPLAHRIETLQMEFDLPSLLGNLRNSHVYQVAGEKDTACAPEHAMLAHVRLWELGADSTLQIVPGARHEINLEPLAQQFSAMVKQVRRPPSPCLVRRYNHLRLGQNAVVEVLQKQDYSRHAKVEAVVDAGRLTLRCENVQTLRVNPAAPEAHRFTAISFAEGKDIPIRSDAASIFTLDKGDWTRRDGSLPAEVKQPARSGSVMDYKFAPFIIIYGTGGDPQEAMMVRELAQGLFSPDEYNGMKALVKADTEVTDEELKENSVVLYGTPATNKILAQWTGALPIDFSAGIRLGARQARDGDVGLLLIYPHPQNSRAYAVCVTGTSPKGMEAVTSLRGADAPDFVWARPNEKAKGNAPKGELIDWGWFNNEWKLPESRRSSPNQLK